MSPMTYSLSMAMLCAPWLSAQRWSLSSPTELQLVVPVAPQPPAPSLFAPVVSWPGIGSPRHLLADLDGDGRPEVVYGLGGASVTSPATLPAFGYRRVLGAGSWSQGPLFQVATNAIGGFRYFASCGGDVDGDGDFDCIMSSYRVYQQTIFPQAPSLWIGDGQGGFLQSANGLPQGAMWLRDGALVDIDSDGDLDLFGASATGAVCFINDGAGRFIDESLIRLPSMSLGGTCVAPIDVDHDGDMDFFVANGQSPLGVYSSQATFVFENLGNGFFGLADQHISCVGIKVLVLDGDRDGHSDVLLIRGSEHPIMLLSRPGQTSMLHAPHVLPSAATSLVWGNEGCGTIDFDLDGDRDLFLDLGSSLRMWENTPAGFVDVSGRMPFPSAPFLIRGGVEGLILDFDFDGDEDLFVGGQNDAGLWSNTAREIATVGIAARGGRFETAVAARGNHTVWSFVSWGPAQVDLQSLGWLWIDPAQSMFLGASLYPRTMAQLVSVPIPNQPWLAGIELRMQCLDVDGFTGQAHLTSVARAVVQ